ncbi:MAG TPA: metallophosphoesterase family protein [Candidatus Hydrogenedentes bacterium]|nr:metallophosphoesterase family protein [Candidatus Hydrogenedentota bacterium]
MLAAVIADLHANLEATRAVFDRLDAIKPDAVICLGDITGYNANPNEVVDIVREREALIIAGNHDAAVCGLEEPWFFNSKARTAILRHAEWLRDDHKAWLANAGPQRIFNERCLAVHGSPNSRDEYIIDWLDAMPQWQLLEKNDIRICFFGHSHRSSLFAEKGGLVLQRTLDKYRLKNGNRYLINPGSVGQPRDGDPRAAFGIFDTESAVFEFHRVEYDIGATTKKILDAGLPPGLVSRLTKGK